MICICFLSFCLFVCVLVVRFQNVDCYDDDDDDDGDDDGGGGRGCVYKISRRTVDAVDTMEESPVTFHFRSGN